MESRNFVTEFKNTIYGISRKSDLRFWNRKAVHRGTATNWKVQEYVIETHDQYPRRMCFDVFGDDKIKQFNIQVGEELNVSFDIDAREWQRCWFNSIRAWKVERVGATPQMPPVEAPFPPVNAAPADFSMTDEKDDLPF